MTASNLQFIYIGKDEVFLKNIIEELHENYLHVQHKVDNIFFKDFEDHPCSILDQIVQLEPHSIFLDFSVWSQKMYDIAWALRTTFNTSHIPIIGVLNTLDEEGTDKSYSDEELSIKEDQKIEYSPALRRGIMTLVHFVHFKGEDYQNMVFDAMYFATKMISAKPQYATYKRMELETSAFLVSKITHACKYTLVVETNLSLESETKLCIKSDELEVIDSKLFNVKTSSKTLLKSPLTNRIKLIVPFLDEEEEDSRVEALEAEFEDDEEDERDEEIELFLTEFRKTKIVEEAYQEWLDSFDEASHQKKFKVLIIQKDLKIINDAEISIDKYPFEVKFQTWLDPQYRGINNYQPHMIAFEMEEDEDLDDDFDDDDFDEVFGDDEDGDEDSDEDDDGNNRVVEEPHDKEQEQDTSKDSENNETYNDITVVENLMSYIKSLEDYNPIVCVFNNLSNAAAFQQTFDYKYILTNPSSVNFDFIEKMVNIFQSDEDRLRSLHQDDLILHTEEPIIFNMLDLKSEITIELPITITSLSEHEIVFLCKHKIPFNSIIRIDFPLPMFVTIIEPFVPLDSAKGLAPHMGLIHGLDTKDQVRIRKYVNFLFFSAKREKEEFEKKEFERKKQSTLRYKEKQAEILEEKEQAEAREKERQELRAKEEKQAASIEGENTESSIEKEDAQKDDIEKDKP